MMYHNIHNISPHACRFGPLQNTWWMCFESKNKEMKHYVTIKLLQKPTSQLVSVLDTSNLCAVY